MKFATLLTTGLLVLSANAATAQESFDQGTRYKVRQTVKIDQIPETAKSLRCWVAIPGDSRFQDVLDMDVISVPGGPGNWNFVRDQPYGNRYLYLEAAPQGKSEVEVVVEFSLNRLPVLIEVDPAKVGPITDDHRAMFAADLRLDDAHMEVTEAIAATGKRVCGDETNAGIKVRKILDHVADFADHYSKDPTKPSCGIGDAGDCMTNGGGCCTDLHSYFIALARSQGIPARLQMGYRLKESNVGKGKVDPGYRCWVEYFLPGYGWIPSDIVEADADGGLGRDRWFQGLTDRRLWLNSGRSMTMTPDTEHAVNHMSIGYAEIDGVPARILADDYLKEQVTRTIEFVEVPAEEPALTSLHTGK